MQVVKKRFIAGFVTALLVASLAHGEPSAVLVGTVTGVIDGDTLDVMLTSGPVRVRLNGVDAPEKNQPGGAEAKKALSDLVFGKQIELEPFEQDRYARLVGTVFIGERNINHELVQRGHAWAYRRYMQKSASGYCADEAVARTAKRGVWGLPREQLVAPWEWRRRKQLPKLTDYTRETAAQCVAAIGKR